MALQLSGEEFEDIKEIFNEIDQDGSGGISLSEFKECLMQGEKYKKEALDFYMKVYDFDRNGIIEFPEFLEVLAYFRYKKNPNVAQIKQIFRALDLDNKGLISADDLRRFHSIFSEGTLLDEATLEELIYKLDTNKDGYIDYSEFFMNYKMFENHATTINM